MLMTLPDHNFRLLRDQLLVSGSVVLAWLAETDLKAWHRLGGTKSCDAGTDVRMRAHEALLRKQLVLLVFWKKTFIWPELEDLVYFGQPKGWHDQAPNGTKPVTKSWHDS